ncbi:hypothetical protein A1O3_05072 [Capronia epimyces CBS 606.96]|uniref:Altered inheritance of mitochondria protein 6 n=1 Tax=Capronia epimyces CBS 606.96 TaxID=1182542 RepID=W9Y452_9EURO|nr:uncharacterized protein A1O3_05072 [Capronia epimyces CBS 606.96]EXJ84405.1 hypothetical protein A1O3_05072 [Capronia epimyces CBS 606.96]
MPHFLSSVIRSFRNSNNDGDDEITSHSYALSRQSEDVPFLTREHLYFKSPDLEDGANPYTDPSSDNPDIKIAKSPIIVTCTPVAVTVPDASFDHASAAFPPTWHWADITPSLKFLDWRGCAVVHKEHILERRSCAPHRITVLRKVLRLLAYSLMLLGLLEFIALACGLLVSFFPDEVDERVVSWKLSAGFSEHLGHWPTDFSADVQPVACHSHNDYWRKEPLFSALHAGCTGVEADVWLYDEDLYVGHSTSALTPERTLRSLYIDPLMKILDQQNPLTSFQPSFDIPRHGVFDTNPAQTLILLIDFKNEGHAIWPYVSEQIDPLREKGYLTYFNGSDVIDGPVTVVVTGNAPFHAVVANPHYRDMFFDAPLALMEKLSDMTPPGEHPTPQGTPVEGVRLMRSKRTSEDKDQGQGLSGAAPLNPSIYSRANSYYASVSFKSAIGPPWHGRLSSEQIEKLRKQIAGAHSRGLKVRYWGVPSWPKGMRNHLWRTLVQEGVDFLNVDDLDSVTRGTWGWGSRQSWFRRPWRAWLPGTT